MGNGDGTFRDETATRFPQTANALPTFIGSMQLLDVNGDGSSDIGAHFIGPDPRQGTFYLAQNGSLTEFANGGFELLAGDRPHRHRIAAISFTAYARSAQDSLEAASGLPPDRQPAPGRTSERPPRVEHDRVQCGSAGLLLGRCGLSGMAVHRRRASALDRNYLHPTRYDDATVLPGTCRHLHRASGQRGRHERRLIGR